MIQKKQRHTKVLVLKEVGCDQGGGGAEGEKEREKELSDNEILSQFYYPASLKKMAAFPYLPHFSVPGKKCTGCLHSRL
jgi:hypothetical protein